MDWPTIIGIASAVASTVLAVVAMGQSLYFYNQAKNTERNTGETLAAIRAQTQTLEKLTGRQLDRLTRFATQPRDHEPAMSYVVTLMRELTNITASSSPVSPTAGTSKDDAVLLGLYNTFYFSGLANMGWSAFMANDKNFEEADDQAYEIIDESHRFYFASLNQLLAYKETDLNRIDVSERFPAFRAQVEHLLHTSAEVRASREQAE